ncbi:hypothetical protein FRC01_003365 [Tulasnella sp. 417]|nr:hypothetical protein FRC01_003365 [Tulasnella sp. 417]
MKAASKTAIGDAAGAVLKSICKENGFHGEYMLDQAVCAPASPKEAQNAIDSLEMTLATLEASMKARIVQARKRRNDFLSINRLPVEMVVEIFRNVLDSDALCPPTFIPYLERLKRLASVCSAWRRLVNGTPGLWAVLESTCPLDFLPTVIRKAKGSPLNIRCADSGRYPGINRHSATAFLCSVIPLANKWATLYVDLPVSTEPPTHQLLEKNTPSLRKVLCKGTGGSVAKPFGGPTPRLKELHLHSVSIDWSFVELKDLSALVLVDSQAPSISQLLAILDRSPELELMELRHSEVNVTDAPSAASNIILPRLKDLILSDIRQQAISFITRSIHSPRFRTFVIIPEITPEDSETAFPALNPNLEHLVPAMQYTLTEGKSVELAISQIDVEFVVKRDTKAACLKFYAKINERPRLQSHLTWLQSSIDLKAECASGIREASVTFGWGTSLENIHLPILEWIPNIRELNIVTHQGTSELIQDLTERICDGNKVEWRCPRLREICFRGFPTPLEDVLEFAQRRYGDRPTGEGPNESGEIIVHWPDTLEHLDVQGVEDMDDETVEDLKAITGCPRIVGPHAYSREASPEDWYDEGYGYSDEDSLGSMDLHDIFALVGH